MHEDKQLRLIVIYFVVVNIENQHGSSLVKFKQEIINLDLEITTNRLISMNEGVPIIDEIYPKEVLVIGDDDEEEE